MEKDLSKHIEDLVARAFEKEGTRVKFEGSGTKGTPMAEERIPGSKAPQLKVAIGSDHRGFPLKSVLAELLRDLGHMVVDCGVKQGETGDYPDIAQAVAGKVAGKTCDRGIVIDMIGVGSAIAANKIDGIRAATCYEVDAARSSRLHNDANILSLGSSLVNRGLARRMVRIWLETPFEGGRHVKRIEKIAKLEKEGLDARL
jgi:ribose 5-phosphate isomerase B